MAQKSICHYLEEINFKSIVLAMEKYARTKILIIL